jgi:hypothetical protein
MTSWEPNRGERLLVAATGIDWSRALLWRSRDHLQRSGSVRTRPIVEELTVLNERLTGLQRLIQVIHAEERGQ